MKWTQAYIPTLREAPAEAEVESHKLLLRAALVRKVAAGIYNFLPLGLRVLRKIERIIREEMNRADALEVLMPALQPTELWEKTGRLNDTRVDFFSAYDRQKKQWVLGPTHEEIITSLVAAEVQSYKQLPKIFYQIQAKFRDEPRPRYGLLRGREFIMKDAYSFDINDAQAETSYFAMRDAYERILKRVGCNYKIVEADTGAIGGSFSHEFSIPASIGESEIAFTKDGTYAAALEKAVSQAHPRKNPTDQKPLERFDTPNVRTIEELSRAPYNISAIDQIKTLVYIADGKKILILLRGDHQLNESKLAAYLKAQEVRSATNEEIFEALGAHAGSLGGHGVDRSKFLSILADPVLRGQNNMATGANQDNVHLRNVCVERDLTITDWVDLRTAQAGELDVKTSEPLQIERAIEVGHIFKLGTKYTIPLEASYLDENSQQKPIIMGCYGIGVTRLLQAVIEEHHDEQGIIWPLNVAPYSILLTELDPQIPEVRQKCHDLYERMHARGWSVLWDDRDERPGVKFKDGDLIGIPWRITISSKSIAKGAVELKARSERDFELVPLDQIEKRLETILSGYGCCHGSKNC